MTLAMAGCLTQEKIFIFRVPLFALKSTKMPSGPLEKGKYVSVSWCPDQRDFSKKKRVSGEEAQKADSEDEDSPEPDVNHPPLKVFDQVALKAAETYKSRYFIDASFYLENDCAMLRGYVAKER